MRIVQAAGWFLPDSLGGTELYVAALAKRVQQAGHEVLVAAPDTSQTQERRYTHDGVAVYRYPIPVGVSRAQARGHTRVPGAAHLHRWLAETRADIVHFHTFVTGLGLLEVEAAAAAGARVIVTSHAASLGFLCERGTLMHRGRSLCDGLVDSSKCARCALEQREVPAALAGVLAHLPSPLAQLATGLPGRAGTALGMRALINQNQRAQQRLFEVASAVVVLSEFAAQVLRANGAPADKVFVNRLGIDRHRGEWTRKGSGQTASPVTAGFVGRAESIKGLEDAVRAVTSLAPEIRIRLKVVTAVATSSEEALVERCRASASGDSRISFLSALAPGEVPAFLAGLDVLVSPSRAVEGGPTVALEAQAVGTPVIGAAMPALTEYVFPGLNGALFPPGDWRRLATILADIASDPAGTIDRWRTNLQPPRTFDDICHDYLALYGRVLS